MPSTLREINIETGMPFVKEALKHMETEIGRSKKMGVRVLKIIHGYGSSGTGGKIRREARRYLEDLEDWGKIEYFITGEAFSIFHEDTRSAFLICNDLRQDRDLDRHNNGVTFIVL